MQRKLGAAQVLACVLLVTGCATSDEYVLDTWTWSDTSADTTPADGTDAADTAPGDGSDTAEAPSDVPTEDGPPDTIGTVCSTEADCQNGLFCDGAERCLYGFCQPGTAPDCDDGAACTADWCDEDLGMCVNLVDADACDDMNPCTVDSCDTVANACVHEETACDDGDECTLDTCDTSSGECSHVASAAACDDGDGCTADSCDDASHTCIHVLTDGDGDLVGPTSCGGGDCNDSDPTIHPGAAEICGDGVDQDCDGLDGAEGTCGCPYRITETVGATVYTGSTSSTAGDHDGTCTYSYYYYTGADEAVFVLTLTASHTVTFETYGSSFDTLIYVRSTTCASGSELDCDDDGGVSLDSYITLSLAAGTYYFFLDGYSPYDYGSYTLTVTIS